MNKRTAFGSGAAIVALIAAAAFGWRWWSSGGLPEGILEGHGRIEAIEVAVASKVPGRIAKLEVREGESVRSGALIAQVSAEEIERRLDQAQSRSGAAAAQLRTRDEETRAQLTQARAGLRAAGERLRQTQERVATLEHHAEKVRADHRRDRDLVAKGFISERQLAKSENALRQAEGDLAEAQRLRAAAQADVEGAQAAVEGVQRQRPALLQALEQEAAAARAGQGELEVSRDELRVVAPIDGTVINRAAEVGELVASGKPIVVLADLARPYMRVYLAERDVGKVKLNDAARVYVDSFPQRPFDALVTEVSSKAEFTPKDVHMPDERTTLVYAVKLEMRNPEGLLKPGMPAAAHIRWKADAPWPVPPRS